VTVASGGEGRGAGRLVGIALALVAALNLGLGGAFVGWHFAQHHNSKSPTGKGAHFRGIPDQQVSAESIRAGAIRALLTERADAIMRHDRSAFLAQIDPQSPQFVKAQSAYFANLQPVPLATWSYALLDDEEAPTDGSQFLRYQAKVWLPHVVLHYRIAGFDSASTSSDVWFTFVQRGGRWLIGSDTDGASLNYATGRDIWDFGPVLVARGHTVLALGHPGGHASLSSLVSEADRDLPRVTRVWGRGWSQRVVVLAPGSASELGKLLGGSAGDLHQIAAVATAELVESGHDARPVGDRVIVNPTNYVKLSAKGRQVVMTHEITHVASRAAGGRYLSEWLTEGFADYVGFRETGIAPTTAAHALKVYLDAGHAVPGLPADSAYDGANKNLSMAYDESWLACRFVADHWGQAALVRLYRAVGAVTTGSEQSATETGLRGVLHTSLAAFTRGWQHYVASVLQ
jgi:hypothetical protein